MAGKEVLIVLFGLMTMSMVYSQRIACVDVAPTIVPCTAAVQSLGVKERCNPAHPNCALGYTLITRVFVDNGRRYTCQGKVPACCGMCARHISYFRVESVIDQTCKHQCCRMLQEKVQRCEQVVFHCGQGLCYPAVYHLGKCDCVNF